MFINTSRRCQSLLFKLAINHVERSSKNVSSAQNNSTERSVERIAWTSNLMNWTLHILKTRRELFHWWKLWISLSLLVNWVWNNLIKLNKKSKFHLIIYAVNHFLTSVDCKRLAVCRNVFDAGWKQEEINLISMSFMMMSFINVDWPTLFQNKLMKRTIDRRRSLIHLMEWV